MVHRCEIWNVYSLWFICPVGKRGVGAIKGYYSCGGVRQIERSFTAENFDADFITDMALKAGMKYITITSKHHDGFCLFRTQQTDFNSLDAPGGSDLIGELARLARKKDWDCFYIIPMLPTGNIRIFIPGKQAGKMPVRPIPNPNPNTNSKRRRFQDLCGLCA